MHIKCDFIWSIIQTLMKFSKWVTYRISALATVYWCFPVWFRTGLWPKAVTFPADTFDLNDWASLDNLPPTHPVYPSPGPEQPPNSRRIHYPVASPPRLYCLTADYEHPPHTSSDQPNLHVWLEMDYTVAFWKMLFFQRQCHRASSQGLVVRVMTFVMWWAFVDFNKPSKS